MKEIKDLLEKFKTVGLKEHKIKDSLIKILEEDLNVKITRNHLHLKDGIITLKISGPQKTEIILQKQKLLEKLNSEIEDLGTSIREIN